MSPPSFVSSAFSAESRAALDPCLPLGKFFQLHPASMRSENAACINSKSSESFSFPSSLSAPPFSPSSPDNFDFRFLAGLYPEMTQSQVTVGIVLGISDRDLSDSARRVWRIPASVTMCVTMAGSYFGTNFPPCFTICGRDVQYIIDDIEPCPHQKP